MPKVTERFPVRRAIMALLRGPAPWIAAAAMVAAVFVNGCTDPGTGSRGKTLDVVSHNDVSEELLANAIGMLNNLDELEISQDPLGQIVERLNQWMVTRSPQDDWEVEPMVADLPERYQKLHAVEWIDAMEFESEDGPMLQEAVWLRNVARSVAGQQLDPLEQAKLLFDWTIRNLQIEHGQKHSAGEAPRISLFPHEAMLFGRATAEERAWVFMMLCRQCGIDSVMLAFDAAASAETKNDEPATNASERGDDLDLWLPAVLIDGQLYLFDTRLGLPIPGPNGSGIATLADAARDDTVLRQLDLDDQHRYPITSEHARHVIALAEGSPLSLSQRAHMVESRLAGEEKVVLATSPTALAKLLADEPQIEDVRLWHFPFECIAERSQTDPDMVKKLYIPYRFPQPMMWKARVLHMMGHYTGEEKSAISHYLQARPPDTVLLQLDLDFEIKELVRANKAAATYWLGVVSFDRKEYELAIQYLETWLTRLPLSNPWSTGARYNLARAYEALGQNDKAVAIYESDQSPQRHGNLLRARRLKESASEKDS